MRKPDFLGLNTQYRLANGKIKKRVHLDGAASPLAAKASLSAIEKCLAHYSNTHSHVHTSAKITTHALTAAHNQVLSFFKADNTDFTSIFIGSGTTAAINRVARGLAQHRVERNVTLISAMEHHANDLPHRQYNKEVHYIPLTDCEEHQGCIDLKALEQLLQLHQDKVNYLTVSLTSNVTGIINPIKEICQLAHQHQCYVLVDAAQAVAHQAFYFSDCNEKQQPDFFVFSGHKVYCPTAPGVLIAKKSLLAQLKPHDLGGGMVSEVSYFDYQLLAQYPEKEQAGTPNIVGAIALANVLKTLSNYGMPKISKHESTLMQFLLREIKKRRHFRLYGNHDMRRIGAISINHEHIDHGLLAAILNDYYGIAVRNECFCAHPYVSSLLKKELWEIDLSDIPAENQQAYINRKRGMVRISISLYNTKEDLVELLDALDDIQKNIMTYKQQYSAQSDGSYVHQDYQINWKDELNLDF